MKLRSYIVIIIIPLAFSLYGIANEEKESEFITPFENKEGEIFTVRSLATG